MLFARHGDIKQTRRQNMAEIVFSWGWNFTMAPSNWTNMIIKLNFICLPKQSVSPGCLLIKLIKYSPADCPTTTSTTVSSSEAAPTKSPTIATSATTPESSNGTVTTSQPTHTKSPTRSKEQQEGESSSVVGIVVGVLVGILVLCGIILGYFCYKRKR
ncbi:Hypothetical predicted protein [Paramuricea clavata]|uniref:Uncharacterized protein n=2 Tax=Paramuricea clavata TaxID=317549 RepID=A0A6S7GNX3_PARCT|nr:Hypothetical predicted protein [Paramuricea clavata]